jgi:hypothetical protein
MRTALIGAVLAILLCASTNAQTREITDSGVFVADAAGRYVRLEGPDGVIVNYLYATAESTETSGIAVSVNDKVTLTVRYDSLGVVAVDGLPALTSLTDHEGRMTAVHADGKPLALFDYTPAGFVAAVMLPGRFTWTTSAPDHSHRVRQSVENALGKVITTAKVLASEVEDALRGASYEAAAAELGVSLDTLRYERSPTGALTTARDRTGRVAFYIVHTDTCDVGFSPDGTPRFYDLTLSVFGGAIPPGSDVLVSPAWDAQRGAVPDHLVLTAGGAAGLYIEAPAPKSIDATWMDRDGKLSTVAREIERDGSSHLAVNQSHD